MSFQTKRELLFKIVPRYREANREQKTIILNEFVAITGYNRKYAIRLLTQSNQNYSIIIKRPRSRYYSKAVQDPLMIAWAASNYIASKRLAPFLKELIPILERHGHIKIDNKIQHQLISISPATIDRILKPLRSTFKGKKKNINSSKKLIKKQIPIRTFSD